MAYRPLLSADQLMSLLAAPTDERTLIRYASLSGEDLDLILSKRGHRNQLGFAVQICLMRFPGLALALNEIPSALLHFLGDQLEVSPAAFADYTLPFPTEAPCLNLWSDRSTALTAAKAKPLVASDGIGPLIFGLIHSALARGQPRQSLAYGR